MVRADKKFSRSGLVALVFLSLIGIIYAQPTHMHEESADGALKNPRFGERILMYQEIGPPNRVPMIIYVSGCGIALKDNESHLLRLEIEDLIPVEPKHIRMLMTSNRSIEEIRKDIYSIQGDGILQGILKLDELIYPMVDIKIAISGENSTMLDADIVEPLIGTTIGNETRIVGHITLTIARSGDKVVGKGKFTLKKDQQIDDYQASLDIFPPRKRRA